MDFLSVITILQSSFWGGAVGGLSSVFGYGLSEAGVSGVDFFLGAFGFGFGVISFEKSGSSVSGSLRHAGTWSLARLSCNFLLSGWRV